MTRTLARLGLALACACGCPRGVHEHHTRGSYCGRHKDCDRWRPRLHRIRLTGEDLRLLAADPRRTP